MWLKLGAAMIEGIRAAYYLHVFVLLQRISAMIIYKLSSRAF